MTVVISVLVVAAVFVVAIAIASAVQSAHEDKLDRRAMYNAVMEMNQRDNDRDLALIGDDMEKLTAWYLDADGKRAERQERNLAIAKKAFNIE